MTHSRFPALIALAAVTATLPVAATAGEISPTRVAALQRLLTHDCGSCHGLSRKGGLGSPLLPENLAGKDPQALADVILDGVPGTPMPPWRPLLTPEEARLLADMLMKGDAR